MPTREVCGRTLSLTNLDKPLWPSFTKRDLLGYYERVAPVLLPHLARRPLTLGRFPDGVLAGGFAQMECRGRPDWMHAVPLELRSGGVRNFCVVDDLASLLWVANLATVELHPYLAPAERLDRPNVVVFDLDGDDTSRCARVALALRDELEQDAVVKTSGSTGLHVYLPLPAPEPYERTRPFAREVAERLAARLRGVTARAANRAAGAVLVDWMQNSERRSTIAPYSLRAADRPLAAAPVAWDEVEAAAAGRDPLRFSPVDVVRRVDAQGDLLAALTR